PEFQSVGQRRPPDTHEVARELRPGAFLRRPRALRAPSPRDRPGKRAERRAHPVRGAEFGARVPPVVSLEQERLLHPRTEAWRRGGERRAHPRPLVREEALAWIEAAERRVAEPLRQVDRERSE